MSGTTTRMCDDYSGLTAAQSADRMEHCAYERTNGYDTTSWSNGPCDRQDVLGGCESVSPFGYGETFWIYRGGRYDLNSAQSFCSMLGGRWVGS